MVPLTYPLASQMSRPSYTITRTLTTRSIPLVVICVSSSRFVGMPDSISTPDLSDAMITRTRGGNNPNGKSQRHFLQRASWDLHVLGRSMGLMRFYERNSQPGGWTYFGDSFHAVSLTYIAGNFFFYKTMLYLNSALDEFGPFDGYIISSAARLQYGTDLTF